jgi:hypothetical protein
MSSLHPTLMRWWHGDKKILYVFALYGLGAGIVMYTASLSYDHLDAISFVSNYPTIVMMFFFFEGRSMPVPTFILIMSSSVATWSFIGLIVYAFTKMFKMGP